MSAFAFLFFAFLANTVEGYEETSTPMRCDRGFETLLQEVLSIEGIELIDQSPEYTSYIDEGARTVYAITRPGQYAHPTIVRRATVQKDGAIYMATSACCYNTKKNCDWLLKEFKALDDSLRKDFQGKQ